MKAIPIGLAVLMALPGGLDAAGAGPGHSFDLDVQKDRVKLVNRDLIVTTVAGRLTAGLHGPFGRFASYGFDYPLADIRVEADTDRRKEVHLVSSVCHTTNKGGRSAIFTLVLTAEASSPGVTLRAESVARTGTAHIDPTVSNGVPGRLALRGGELSR